MATYNSLADFVEKQRNSKGARKNYTGASAVIPAGITLTLDKAQPFLATFFDETKKEDGYYIAYQAIGSDKNMYNLSYGMLFSAQYTTDGKLALRRCKTAQVAGLTPERVAIVSGNFTTRLVKDARRVVNYQDRKPVFDDETADIIVLD